MEKFAFETALFDEPAGVDLVAVFAVMDGIAFVGGGLGGFFGEINIMEERASAGFFHWVGEFVSADSANDVADAFWAKVGDVVVVDIFLNRIVEGARHLAGLQR